MMSQDRQALCERIAALCVQFGLTSLREQLGTRFSQAGLHEALPLLVELLEQEQEERRQRRTQRLLRAAQLPPQKTLASLDQKVFTPKLRLQIEALCSGEFIGKAYNALLFGLPGVGKTHVAAAIGAAVCQLGLSVRFVSTSRLVQDLLLAKKECQLPRALRKLDAFDLLICDDIGYLQQSPEEAEVLFTLIAERYERRSLLLTTNLIFSQWNRIFRDEMATAAAVDRLVHHAVIVEFDKDSYRSGAAARRAAKTKEAHPSS
jgi:DNA replication protein DnaC